MMIVPTVVAMYNAHKERLARINAAAFKSPQIIFPVTKSPAEQAKDDAKREAERVRVARANAARAATHAKKAAAARGPLEKEKPVPFFAELLNEVARYYDVTTLGLKSSRRDAKIVRPRQVVCYLAYSETAMSYPAIGRLLGNRDHTTVLYGVRKIEKLLKEDKDEDLTVAIFTIKLRLQDRVQARVQNLAAIA